MIALTAAFVVYPIYYLIQASLDVGDAEVRPPTAYGLDNFAALPRYSEIMLNTLLVAFGATVMALVFGFLTAWILNRTNVPWRRTLEQAMAVPYYVTPLLGALAWSLLGAPESGFLNQVWRACGGSGAIIDIATPLGIAWVMALFEGSVAFVMIGAVMKSMDPGTGRSLPDQRRRPVPHHAADHAAFGHPRCSRCRDLRLRRNARLLLRRPWCSAPPFVSTLSQRRCTQLVSQYPPRIPLAAAMGVSLFAVMALMLFFYRRIIARRSYVTVSGKAFRPRLTDVGGLRWVLFAVCASYVLLSVVLPILTLVYASVQHLAVAFPTARNFTLDNYRQALSQNAVRFAMSNSLLLGVMTATLGVALTGMLSWLIHRSRIPGRGLLEYTVMFPQAVPRLVFAFGMMWAWLVFPIPIYGTLWLLLIAYLTVFLPLGVRTISSVLLQLDKSLEECGEVCGASWGYRMRTITMPLLRPGLIAAWMLLFIASVRELGASILLMGPHSQVLTPAIVDAWFGSSSELTAAMALIQTCVVGIVVAIFMAITRRASRQGG